MSMYPSQVSFAAGEVAPSLYGRDDLAKYAVGLRTLTNFIVHPHGGVSNRPGMRFVSETKNSGKARLVPFEFSNTDVFVIEFGNMYIRFYKDGAPVLKNGAVYEVVSPWNDAELMDLSFAQSADVLYVVHPSHSPMELARYSDNDWRLESFAFVNGPFRNVNGTDITMKPSSLSGSCTVTASVPFFQPGHVGALIGIYNDADEVSAQTQGGVTGVPVAVTLTKRTVDMVGLMGMVIHIVAFFASASDVSANVIKIGSAFTVAGVNYSVTGMESTTNGYKLTTSPSLANVMGKSTAPIAEAVPTSVLNVDSVWGAEVTVYRAWSFETRGFWSGTVRFQRYSKDESRWIDVYVLTSGASAGSSKNYTKSGTVDEPTKFRIVSADFNQFLPSGNAEADKGFCILIAGATTHMGIARITNVAANGLSASVSVLRDFINLNATKNWVEGAWSNYRGWPSSLGFHEDRLCFGGTRSDPQTIWMSVTGDYSNFEKHLVLADDDSVTASLVSRRVSPVRAFVSLSNLVVMTSSAEWIVSAGSGKSAISPTSIDAKAQSYRGCANIDPVVIGNMILFVQKQGKVLRDLGYTFESDSYNGNDLTILATHLFRDSEIVAMDYQQDPDSIVWVLLANGTLLSLTYLREHDVIAWSRIETEGVVESVCCVSGNAHDDVWLVVRRDIGGVSHRFVEKLADRNFNSPEECFFVDCGVSRKESVSFNEVSGLAHLNGCEVTALIDGSVKKSLLVTEGKISLSNPAMTVHVGLPYNATLETLDLDISTKQGTGQGRKSRVVSAALRFERTRGVMVGTVESDGSVSADEFKERSDEPYGSPIRLFTGIRSIAFSSGYSEGRIRVIADKPLPCTLLSILPKVVLGDR